MARVIAAALLALGCGQLDPSGELFPEPARALSGVQASPALLPYCERAARRWEAATGILISCTEGPPLVYGDVPEGAWGWTNEDGRVHILPGVELVEFVVLHELGHSVFHAGGHPDYGSAMCWAATGGPISAADITHVCENYPCTWFQPEGEAIVECPREPD